MKNVYILLFILAFGIQDILSQHINKEKKISSDLFGIFFEDINYAADGGLYAEMVQNRSFEYNPSDRREWHPFSYWEYITPGFSYGKIYIETSSPIHQNNPHYVVLEIENVGHYDEFKGESGVGLKNNGFGGMVINAGDNYKFSVFGKLLSENPVDFLVALQNRKGEIIGESKIKINTHDWQKYETIITAKASYDTCSLIILGKNEGKVALDMISLFPEKTFKNRSNGLRADLAQIIADLKPKFVRFPGGCLVHGDGIGNMYRWKNSIGPLEQRKAQRNIWGYHQSLGLGFYEYFQFCEDIGAKPLPVLPAGVSCQNSGGTWRIGGKGQKAIPMEEMHDYIQEVLDFIEWAIGPADSKWGSKRAEAGHPEPFKLEYLAIGNEEKITPEFVERFKMIYKAVKERYPEIKIIGTAGPFAEGEDFEKGWALANELNIDIVDEHYYNQPEWFLANQYRYDKYDRNKSKVFLGEYASWGNKLRNAIIEAAYMTSLERNGDVVVLASYAPLLAKKGNTQWRTDLIFFDNKNIVLTPNYYVQKLFMNNQGDLYYDNVIIKDSNDSTIAVSCVKDSKSGDIILKLVNAGIREKIVKIDLNKFKIKNNLAEKTLLTGEPDAENTFENPEKIKPIFEIFRFKGKKFDYTLPPMSLTVLRIKTKS